MDNDLDLTALRAFRAVVKTGSFAAAANLLKAPKSTLSKRVADLESDLGVRLIERTTRRLRITSEGEVLAGRADRILGEAEDLRRALSESGGQPRGHLRIAVPGILGTFLLGAIAARFRQRYPEITLEVLNFDRVPDLLEEGFDGAIRFGPLDDSGQVARALRNVSSVMVAPPDLSGIETIAEPADLASFPAVGIAPAAWANCTLSHVTTEASVELRLETALGLGSHIAIRDAVLEGAGIASLPYGIARSDLRSGRLVRLLPDWIGHRKQLFFIYPAPQSATARLRALIDTLVAEVARTGPWCSLDETELTLKRDYVGLMRGFG